MPQGSFKSSERPTGVNTRIVVIEKTEEAIPTNLEALDTKDDKAKEQAQKESIKGKTLNELIADNAKDVEDDLKSKSKRLDIVAKGFAASINNQANKTISDDVEKVLSATGVGNKLPEYLQKALDVKEGVEDIFVFEPKLKDYPMFRNAVRLFKGVTKDAREFSAKQSMGWLATLVKRNLKFSGR